MIITEILDQESVDNAVSTADYVLNFAGFADLDASATKPINTIKQKSM